MSFTLEELRIALEDYEDEHDQSDFYHEIGYVTEGNRFSPEGWEINGIGTAWGVDSQGGGEGGGEERWVVFRIAGDDRLFRKNGYYASHDGSYFDGKLEQVEAFEKTVTDYRRV